MMILMMIPFYMCFKEEKREETKENIFSSGRWGQGHACAYLFLNLQKKNNNNNTEQRTTELKVMSVILISQSSTNR